MGESGARFKMHNASWGRHVRQRTGVQRAKGWTTPRQDAHTKTKSGPGQQHLASSHQTSRQSQQQAKVYASNTTVLTGTVSLERSAAINMPAVLVVGHTQ